MSQGLNITIIGAGLGGLSAALALSHANPNHQIRIYESNPGLSEFGAGVLVSANSIRIFDSWGLYESMKKIAVEASALEFRRWENNARLFANPHNPRSERLYEYPRWSLYRPDLQSELYNGLDRCKNISVLFGKKIVHVDHTTATVTLEDGTVVEADLAIAADGIGSKCRHYLPGSEDITPTPWDEHAYRFVLSKERMLSNDITASLMNAHESYGWVGPHTVVMAYKVAAGDLFNVVISTHRPNPGAPPESWTYPGDVEKMRQLVSGWCPEVQALTSLVKDGECTLWTFSEVSGVSAYASPSGRLAVIGDAAHAVIPHAGQGVGMAVEDAASLAEFLNHLKYLEDLPKVMGEWSKFRLARVESIRRMSHANAGVLLLPDGPEQIARDEQWAVMVNKMQTNSTNLADRPAPNPDAKSIMDPGGAMWALGWDVFKESREVCMQRL